MNESPATILVVDDLPANRDLMVRRLQRSGFQVLAAVERSRRRSSSCAAAASTWCCSTS